MHAPGQRLTPNRQQGVHDLEDAHAPLEPVVQHGIRQARARHPQRGQEGQREQGVRYDRCGREAAQRAAARRHCVRCCAVLAAHSRQAEHAAAARRLQGTSAVCCWGVNCCCRGCCICAALLRTALPVGGEKVAQHRPRRLLQRLAVILHRHAEPGHNRLQGSQWGGGKHVMSPAQEDSKRGCLWNRQAHCGTSGLHFATLQLRCTQLYNSGMRPTCTAATGSVQSAASPSSLALGCLSASGRWRRLRLAGHWRQQACADQLGDVIRQAWMHAPFTCKATAAGQAEWRSCQSSAPEPRSQHQQRQEGAERLQHPQRCCEVDSAVADSGGRSEVN